MSSSCVLRCLFACVVFALSGRASLHAAPALVWLTLDSGKIGSGVSITGSVRCEPAGAVTLQPWLHDQADAVAGRSFTLVSELTKEAAAEAKKGRAYQPALPKGLLVSADVAPGASLHIETSIGSVALRLADLAEQRMVHACDGRLRLCLLPSARRLTGADGEQEYPSVALLPDGGTVVTYVEWDGATDRVVLRRGDKMQVIADDGSDMLDPRCAVDASGEPVVVWTAGRDGVWDLWLWRAGKTTQLTNSVTNEFWPRLARSRDGQLWLAWQRVADNAHYEVMLAALTASGLGQPINVSEHAADDWEPAVCATADGRVVVAWDTYRNGSYDVYLRRFTIAGPGLCEATGGPLPVAATLRREAHASVAADGAGRIWVAWDSSVADWGKHPKRASLHSDRRSHVACLAGTELLEPEAALMLAVPKPIRPCVEYPHVAVDGAGRVWVLFRVQNRVQPVWLAPKGRAQRYGMWHEFAMCLTSAGWSEPRLLGYSNGRQDIRPATAVGADGALIAVYAADGRTRRFPYMPVDYDVATAVLRAPVSMTGQPKLVPAPKLGVVTPAPPDTELAPLPRDWRVAGRSYRMLLGDTHRHTDISRCANGRDGSLQDAYRYALNTCELDWLAISDHDQDILKHRHDREQRPRQHYDWWRSQKYCDLYSIPGRFVAVYGYEHGGSYSSRGGHKNVLYARRGLPVYEENAPEELFTVLANSGAIAIPHQLSDGASRMDWDKWNADYERVAEIFQARGSYEYQGCPREARVHTEGGMLWDALAKGIRIGIIASSDHGQTHQARAGVFVESPGRAGEAARRQELTRENILNALKARRTFGATTAISMQVQMDGHAMGEKFTVRTAPTLTAAIAANAPIRQLDVIRNNEFVFVTQPGSNAAEITFTDADLEPGQEAYYYLRALIGPNDVAWTSPFWVARER